MILEDKFHKKKSLIWRFFPLECNVWNQYPKVTCLNVELNKFFVCYFVTALKNIDISHLMGTETRVYLFLVVLLLHVLLAGENSVDCISTPVTCIGTRGSGRMNGCNFQELRRILRTSHFCMKSQYNMNCIISFCFCFLQFTQLLCIGIILMLSSLLVTSG